jgi:hypothetical protein
MNNLFDLIEKKNWYEIANNFEVETLAKELSFEKGMFVATQLLFNEDRDDGLREFATQLLQKIRSSHPSEWSSDWKNDVLLGDASYITMNFEEQYNAYKRAFEKAQPPSPSLLIALAGCYLSPEKPITIDEAEKLAKQALRQEPLYDGIVLLRGIYALKEDKNKFEYWDKIFQETQNI